METMYRCVPSAPNAEAATKTKIAEKRRFMLFLDFSKILSVAALQDAAAGHGHRRDRRSELRRCDRFGGSIGVHQAVSEHGILSCGAEVASGADHRLADVGGRRLRRGAHDKCGYTDRVR